MACATLLGAPTLEAQLDAGTAEALAATQVAVQTQAAVPTAALPTQTTDSLNPDYFREEFAQDLADWSSFVVGDEASFAYTVANNQIALQIADSGVYAYLLYDGANYQDVELAASVSNSGGNENYMTLICRESEEGWYEFNITSLSAYEVYYYDGFSGEFRLIESGLAEDARPGDASNEFRAICQGNQLSLYVNGGHVTTVTDNRLSQGHIGLGAGALDASPITISFDWLDVRQP